MIKKIPGNINILVNLQGDFFDNYGTKIQLKRIDKFVYIELFGKIIKRSVIWVSLLAWYELDHIHDLDKHIDKIKFYNPHKILRVSCGKIMMFSEPIYYKEGFRFIPNYSRYAINIDSDVLDTLTGKIVTDREILDEYEVIFIYSPDKGGNRNTRVHRLMALAWLPNNDFINKPIVNHIDGNKTNNKLSNLEWCTYERNSNHAFDIGLNSGCSKMKTRDIVTGEIVIYRSAGEMSRVLGMSNIVPGSLVNKLPGAAYKKRYEIKYFDDDSPWYYENKNEDFSFTKSIFTITVLDKSTGEINRFSNSKKFRNKYKLHSGLKDKRSSLDYAIGLFKEKYPDLEVSYVRNSIIGPYFVHDLENSKAYIFKSIIESAAHIGRSRTELQYDLSRGFKFIYSNKWVVVPRNKDFNLNDYKNKPTTHDRVSITNVSTGVETIANSIKHAATVSGVEFRTVKRRIFTGEPFKGFVFRSLKQ